MVQPQYSPQEALERVKLMMKYDTSKTLNENKETIKEQYVAPAVAAGATGAATGAGLAAGTSLLGTATIAAPSSIAAGSAAAAALKGTGLIGAVTGTLGVGAATAGAIVGGAAALAVLPLVYWLVTKDTGANKVKKMFEMCSTEAAKIAKLPRNLQDTDLRSISDDIEDAIINDSFGFQGGTDEEKLFGAFKKLEAGTASDFCALVQYYNKNSDSGDLWDDLDSDIDAESEWKQIFRPIRNCVEDSLLTIKDDETPVPEDEKIKEKTGGYTPCKPNQYVYGCKTDVTGAVGQVQECLGLVVDGKFGPKTRAALKAKGVKSFTDADVEKICIKTQEQPNDTENPYADYVDDEIETGTADNTGTPNNTDEPIEQ
jgi:hypothetical protein